METPIVTLKELAKYLMDQPDSKVVIMSSCENAGTGCLMTQYGRDKGWDFTRAYALYQEWEKENPGEGKNIQVATLENHPRFLFENNLFPSTTNTFGRLKMLMKEEYKG